MISQAKNNKVMKRPNGSLFIGDTWAIPDNGMTEFNGMLCEVLYEGSLGGARKFIKKAIKAL